MLCRRKITQPATPETTLKKKKINGNSDTSTLLNMSVQSAPSVLINEDDDDDDTDEDIFILESTSTPKVKKPAYGLMQVKMEPEQSDDDDDDDVSILWECNDDDAPQTSVAAVGTSPTPALPLEVASSTTQTEGPKVKVEEEEQVKTEEEERPCHSTSTETGGRQSLNVDIGVSTVEQRQVKLENIGDAHSANAATQDLQNRMTHSADSDKVGGPSRANAYDENQSPLHYANVPEAQDQLVEPMQATAGERDPFQEQVQKLSFQLQDMQKSLQRPTPVNVKKACSHQATQTEGTEGGTDFKALFEMANQKIDELIKKEISSRSAESNPSVGACEEDSDEVALHVDRLMREVDEITKERDELRAKVSVLAYS